VNLTALVDRPDHVCCRYRIAAFRPFLEQAGHTLTIRTLRKRWWARLFTYPTLRGATLIVQRRLLHAWELALLNRLGCQLIFDFDDAVFLRDSYAARGLHDRDRLRRFAATLSAAEMVVAGNRFLCEQARLLAPAARIHLIPTCVDPTRYRPHSPRADDRMKLVWIGTSSTLQGLEQVRPMLERIGETTPRVELKLVCDRSLTLASMPVEHCPWSESGEADAIASADVGIAWVPDDLWSRGKCGLKVLQYMAAGLPVIANPVGVHCEMIRHGENGFLARTEEEWLRAVGLLARDPALRQRMGAAGRRLVEAEYGVRVGGRLWLDLLDKFPDAARVAGCQGGRWCRTA
jgi:glycosyltransferase involved in cell wall biosynthesis